MKKFRHIAGAVVLAIGLAISPIATAIGPATETVYAEAPEWAKLTITVPSTITHPNSDGEYVLQPRSGQGGQGWAEAQGLRYAVQHAV